MNPVKAYKETQIKTASQGKLIIMLYDEALRQIDTAATELASNTPSLDAVSNALVKAQDLVTELIVSLDFERGGEIARGLFSLYLFFNKQLIDANIRKDAEPLKEVHRMLTELRAAWVEIAGRVGTGEIEKPIRGVNIAG